MYQLLMSKFTPKTIHFHYLKSQFLLKNIKNCSCQTGNRNLALGLFSRPRFISLNCISSRQLLQVHLPSRTVFRKCLSTGSGAGGSSSESSVLTSFRALLKRFFTTSEALCEEENDSDSSKKGGMFSKYFKRTRGEVSRKEQDAQIWKETKAYFAALPLEEKRQQYKCFDRFVVLEDVQTWPQYYKEHRKTIHSHEQSEDTSALTIDEDLNRKVSLWRGDITTLEIDSIVNAANESLLGGGGVDGAIHRAAGSTLVQECHTLNGCEVGQAKITGGYKLPAKSIIHTVGPIGSGDAELRKCYLNSLILMVKHGHRATAFPCISTGIYGFPNERAAHIVLGIVREFLEQHRKHVDRVIICLYLPRDVAIYERLMLHYFPVTPSDDPDDDSDTLREKSTSPKKKSPKKDAAISKKIMSSKSSDLKKSSKKTVKTASPTKSPENVSSTSNSPEKASKTESETAPPEENSQVLRRPPIKSTEEFNLPKKSEDNNVCMASGSEENLNKNDAKENCGQKSETLNRTDKAENVSSETKHAEEKMESNL